jgi:hypothetical protein
MKILSIGTKIEDNRFDIVTLGFGELTNLDTLEGFDYILISGGDGAIRRVIKTLHHKNLSLPPFILNPIGSFNVIAKLHRVPQYTKVLDTLANNGKPTLSTQAYYGLNDEVFLFSAGNMGDLQHIFLAETLRFGLLKKGMGKYLLAGLFLFPVHLVMTPFMLLSPRRFFIFTPASFITKFGSFRGKVEETFTIDLENTYNLIELDGDVVTIEESLLSIQALKNIEIVSQI